MFRYLRAKGKCDKLFLYVYVLSFFAAMTDYVEQDEAIVDRAIQDEVFYFMSHSLVCSDFFFKEVSVVGLCGVHYEFT